MRCFHAASTINGRRDVGSKCRDSSNHPPFFRISVNPPYLRHPDPLVNDLGLEQKDYYMTSDVCKVLNIKLDTFRQRIYRGYYPEYQKIDVEWANHFDRIVERYGHG